MSRNCADASTSSPTTRRTSECSWSAQKEAFRQYSDSLMGGVLLQRIRNLNMLSSAYMYLLENENIPSDDLLQILNEKAEAERMFASLPAGISPHSTSRAPPATLSKSTPQPICSMCARPRRTFPHCSFRWSCSSSRKKHKLLDRGQRRAVCTLFLLYPASRPQLVKCRCGAGVYHPSLV